MNKCGNCFPNATIFSPFPPAISWILGILSAMVSISTIVGNLLVIASFFFERALRTSTNYFIASLAVTDILIGIFSMNFYTIYLLLSFWPLGELFCDLWLSLDYTACLTSQYTVFFITVDRFCSVKIPAKYRNWRTDNKVRFMVAITWIVPMIVFFTTIMGWPYLNPQGRTRKNYQCYAEFASEPIFNTILTIAYFWITLIVMIILYTGIYNVALNLQEKSDNKRKRLNELIPSSSKKQTETSESGIKSSNLSQSLSNSIKQSSYNFEIMELADNNSSRHCDNVRYYHLEKNINSLRNPDNVYWSNDNSLNNGSESEIFQTSYAFLNSSGCEGSIFIYSSHLKNIESPYIPVENEICHNLNNECHSLLQITNNCKIKIENEENEEISSNSKMMYSLPGLSFIDKKEINSLLTKQKEADIESCSTLSNHLDYSPVWIKRDVNENLNIDELNIFVNPKQVDGDNAAGKLLSKRSSSLFAPIRIAAQRLYKTTNKTKKRRERSVSRARKALRTITFILGAFVLSWTPFHIIVLIKGFCDSTKDQHTCVNSHLYNLAYWLCYLNSPINPFCYALANVQFKRTFLRILRCDLRRS